MLRLRERLLFTSKVLDTLKFNVFLYFSCLLDNHFLSLTKPAPEGARSEGKSQKPVTFQDHIEKNTLKVN